MKIFDFSEGVKGKFLGYADYCGGLGGWWLNGLRVNADSVQVGRYQYHEFLYGKNSVKILPENFGVKAICFCQVFETFEGKVYNWSYTANKDWLDNNTNWYYDDKANEDNKKGMIEELRENDKFIDYKVYLAKSYDDVKKEWLELKKV